MKPLVGDMDPTPKPINLSPEECIEISNTLIEKALTRTAEVGATKYTDGLHALAGRVMAVHEPRGGILSRDPTRDPITKEA